MKKLFLLFAFFTSAIKVIASEPVVRIDEPLSFIISDNFKILNAKDSLDYFIVQCPGHSANQLKEKFVTALNDLRHMSEYYETKLCHNSTSYDAGEPRIKIALYEVPFYAASYNMRKVPLVPTDYIQDVQHRFKFDSEITIEFRDGRIKVKIPQIKHIYACKHDGIAYDGSWESYLRCKDRPGHYAVNHKKMFYQRCADINHAVRDMYMELFDAVNNREKALEYKDSMPKTVKVSADSCNLFYITPEGKIANTVSSRPYIDVAIPTQGFSKEAYTDVFLKLSEGVANVRTTGNNDEYTMKYNFETNIFRYEIKWVYIFYDTYVRVFPPKLIECANFDKNIFYNTMRDYLICNSCVDKKNGFKKINSKFVEDWNKIINSLSFQTFIDIERAYKKHQKEDQW